MPAVPRKTPPLLLVFALGAAAACGGPSGAASDPSGVVRAYLEASERGDVEAVHALLDQATRDELTIEELRADYAANRDELASHAAALRAPEARPVTTAEVELPSGEVVTLTLEEGAFRIAGGVLEASAATTPEAAVAGLRNALMRKSLPALLRVLSRSTRAELEADIERLLAETEDTLDLEIAESGDRATVRLGGGGVVELVREAGEWRVEDIR